MLSNPTTSTCDLDKQHVEFPNHGNLSVSKLYYLEAYDSVCILPTRFLSIDYSGIL
jgi:hypothetical protein